MSSQPRYKGKFIKQKTLERRLKFLEALRERKRKERENEAVQIKEEKTGDNPIVERRILKFKVLVDGLYCVNCRKTISLKKETLEQNSIVYVVCDECSTVTKIQRDKVHRAGDSKHCSAT